MTQFLKKHAKLFYLIFGVFGFLFVVIACFYITPYSDTAVNYNSDILSGKVTSITTGNEYLALFCRHTSAYSFDSLYQILYSFNKQVQAANNMILTLGVVSLVMLAIMAVCANLTRKKYYISNLVSGVVCPAITIIVAIVTLVYNFLPLGKLAENYDALNWGALANDINYEKVEEQFRLADKSSFAINSTPLIIYGVIIIIFIVISALLLAYNVYRYLLTKHELAEKVVE